MPGIKDGATEKKELDTNVIEVRNDTIRKRKVRKFKIKVFK
jgi:hypothetical protein